MRVLIIHHEAQYFAGAERVLGYFLTGLAERRFDVTVAAVRESRVREVIPEGVKTCWIPENARFSPMKFLRQGYALTRRCRSDRFDVIHGWAARDWELTGWTGRWARRATVGTLHDHPRAAFISPSRQRLMRWAGGWGLNRIVCVSDAVARQCAASGYPESSLAVVHNGLPPAADSLPVKDWSGTIQLGFLGQFSERKGLRGLFQTLDQLARTNSAEWELQVAGEAQDEAGRQLIEQVRSTYCQRAWWPRVHWRGWVKRPREFLSSIHLLVFPSSDFDPFPTVLLEAGQAGVPVVAARVGGVEEIIEDGQTGWLFEKGDWAAGAEHLRRLLEGRAEASAAGERAKKRVEREFTMKRMVENYLKVYMDLSPT